MSEYVWVVTTVNEHHRGIETETRVFRNEIDARRFADSVGYGVDALNVSRTKIIEGEHGA